MASIYFDNNSTTALDAQVLKAMLPFMTMQQGNATSRHVYGRTVRDAVERAREQVANAVGAYPTQVVFTASGTEANNFAINGIAGNLPNSQIAVSSIEHPCVTRPTFAMQKYGYKTKIIGVDHDGLIDLVHLENILKNSGDNPTSLVSVMTVNNETGVIQDVRAVAEIAKRYKAHFHTDAVQALGKIPVDFAGLNDELNMCAMTISSHKIYGPQGAGALVLDKRIDILPLLHGGGQEKGLRSGTENVAAIVGFGEACELAVSELYSRSNHTRNLRDHLEQGLTQMGAVIFGNKATRITNTSFFAFPNIEGETLVMALDRKGFAVASGSACSSDSTEPSHVLLAMGVAPDLARGAVRVSFAANVSNGEIGSNTIEQVDEFLVVLKQELQRLKQMTGVRFDTTAHNVQAA